MQFRFLEGNLNLFSYSFINVQIAILKIQFIYTAIKGDSIITDDSERQNLKPVRKRGLGGLC